VSSGQEYINEAIDTFGLSLGLGICRFTDLNVINLSKRLTCRLTKKECSQLDKVQLDFLRQWFNRHPTKSYTYPPHISINLKIQEKGKSEKHQCWFLFKELLKIFSV
jgi:hypothetical protein